VFALMQTDSGRVLASWLQRNFNHF